MTTTITRDLAERTVASLLLLATRSGHLAQRVTQESRGNCLPPGRCTPPCREWQATFVEWTEILEALDAERPAQLALIGEEAV